MQEDETNMDIKTMEVIKLGKEHEKEIVQDDEVGAFLPPERKMGIREKRKTKSLLCTIASELF